MDPINLVPIVRHLRSVGGTDIVIDGHAIYEISVRKLDRDTVRQAVRNVIDEKETPHDPASA